MKSQGSWRVPVAGIISVVLLAAGCSSGSSTAGGPASKSAAGNTVKVGVLQSLSGTMAISEVAVKNSALLAIKEINASGGVLGKQIEPLVEDGESKPEVFAQKSEKLITTDKVSVVFGGWTSSSRKAMKPVVEGTKSLLFYPVQYEGLEVSPNIFYTGATTNQQIIPALDYLKEKGLTKIFLVGSDYVFPRTANKEIKAYAAANGFNQEIPEEYLQLGDTNVQGIVAKVLAAKPQVVFNTLNGDSNVSFFKELKAKGNTPSAIQTVSVSIAEEEVPGIGVDNLAGNLVSWNYYQTTDNARNRAFVAAYQKEYGADKPTSDPMEAGYNSVYLWKAAVEKAGSFEVGKVRTAAAGVTIDAPEGTLTVDAKNHHVFKTARIGMINAKGQIDEVWNSGKPVAPDPCLDTYAWAGGLATGQARAECDAVK